jgi:CBS domain-containing membrane protein
MKRARDLMSPIDVKTVNPEDSLAYAAEVMLAGRFRHLPVVRGSAVVGVLSERDILRRGSEVGARGAAVDSVAAAMSHPAVTAEADEPLVSALTTMLDRKLGCLPVVGPGGLIGMITTTEVLRHELDRALERPAERLQGRAEAHRDEPPAFRECRDSDEDPTRSTTVDGRVAG